MGIEINNNNKYGCKIVIYVLKFLQNKDLQKFVLKSEIIYIIIN